MEAKSLAKYLSKQTIVTPEPALPKNNYRAAVVIPALAEYDSLPATLRSLADNHPTNVMVLAVVNNSLQTPPDKIAENQRTLAALRQSDSAFHGGLLPGKNLFWLDAASPGREISVKGGVGEARKLGMDSCLEFLEQNAIFYCLDADTLVSPDYLSAGADFLGRSNGLVAATFNFHHQGGATMEEENAICQYELFMRYYVIGLRAAGSPYACHALGSALACTAETYVRAGGMRARNGGEDFYFLQAARKLGQVGIIPHATVYPSARASDRVPFGTGPKIMAIVNGKALGFYAPKVFMELKNILEIVKKIESVEELSRLDDIFRKNLPAVAVEFLDQNNFGQTWPGIFENTPKKAERLRQAFHIWFDAFRTLKFIHHLENSLPDQFKRLGPLEAFAELLKKTFHDKVCQLPLQPTELLNYLRQTDDPLLK